ncbi:hypothetical protein UFOVP46_4 [uncultured Caudovirales phage]|uniref:Uncharacterized protein n=1 Tax=uncultured Caudovirales phage TaxID=2100421 RepID=A0A6J5KR32_9CAUD|nr:hypothetical protein UFOVP46_4 [uncultured Caudovirales phage]
MSYSTLGQAFPLDTNVQDVYISAATNGAIISTLGVTNSSSSAVTGRVFIRQSVISRSYQAQMWSARTSGFSSTQINALTAGNGLFIAGGASGTMSYSPDGINWTTRTSGFSANAINALTFGNGLFIAGGAAGTMTTSADGITWTSRTSGFTTNAINALTYGKNLYVAGGVAGTLTTSTDGITWTSRTSGFGANAINGLTFGLGQFAAAGASIDNGSYSSGLYVAVGAAGTLTTSPDGITWTSRTSGFGANAISAVAFGYSNQITESSGYTNHSAQPLFVAVGAAGTITTSPDGITWTARTSGVSTAIASIVFANGLFVATTTTSVYLFSTDGVNWSHGTAGGISSVNLLATAYNNGRWAIAGASGQLAISNAGIPQATKQTAIVYDTSFPANSFTPVTIGMTLANYDALSVQSNAPAALTFTVFGNES